MKYMGYNITLRKTGNPRQYPSIRGFQYTPASYDVLVDGKAVAALKAQENHRLIGGGGFHVLVMDGETWHEPVGPRGVKRETLNRIVAERMRIEEPAAV